jgi:integrase
MRQLLHETSGAHGLVATLLYGTGMRLMEGLRLRVKDIEFERREIVVRAGKGGKDRVTVLPENLVLPLQEHLARRRARHQADAAEGHAAVWLPDALATKYPPPRPRRAGSGSSPPTRGPRIRARRAPAAPPASAIGAARRLRGRASCGHRQAVFAALLNRGGRGVRSPLDGL